MEGAESAVRAQQTYCTRGGPEPKEGTQWKWTSKRKADGNGEGYGTYEINS